MTITQIAAAGRDAHEARSAADTTTQARAVEAVTPCLYPRTRSYGDLAADWDDTRRDVRADYARDEY